MHLETFVLDCICFFRLTMFVPFVVILVYIRLISCFVSYQPEQVHLSYGGKDCTHFVLSNEVIIFSNHFQHMLHVS